MLDDLDITTDTDPPRELFVEVRVLEDLGEVVLAESGTVKLTKGSTHLLRRTEVSALVKQGVVAEVMTN